MAALHSIFLDISTIHVRRGEVVGSISARRGRLLSCRLTAVSKFVGVTPTRFLRNVRISFSRACGGKTRYLKLNHDRFPNLNQVA